MDWDFPGLQTAVKIDGKINDPATIDRGWAVELAFPWAGMNRLFAKQMIPPKNGDTLRASFSRFEPSVTTAKPSPAKSRLGSIRTAFMTPTSRSVFPICTSPTRR